MLSISLILWWKETLGRLVGPRAVNYGIIAATAKSLKSRPTLCDPIDESPPGFPVRGILQARTLEWVAISFSNAWKWKVKVKVLSHVQLFVTPWTAAHQAPPPWDFPGKSTGVGCHCLLLRVVESMANQTFDLSFRESSRHEKRLLKPLWWRTLWGH